MENINFSSSGLFKSRSVFRHKTSQCSDRIFSEGFRNKIRKNVEKQPMQPCTYELLKPGSSLNVNQSKEKLLGIYKSRLLPSQFFLTPANLIEKMTEKIYNKPSKADKRLSFEIESSSFHASLMKPVSKPSHSVLKKSQSPDKQNYLEDSCKVILEENKKSRKNLIKISKYLQQKASCVQSLTRDLEDFPNTQTSDFKLKLKQAHNYLIKKSMILSKNPERQHKLIAR